MENFKDEPGSLPPHKKTRSVDGLRGLAVMHVVIGHICAFTNWQVLTAGLGTEAEANVPSWPGGMPCPEGWSLHQGACFSAVCKQRNWEEAEKHCGGLVIGAHLASLDSEQQLRWVQEDLFEDRAWWWVGLEQQETKDFWKWSDGSNSTLRPWRRGEPNIDGQACGYMRSGKARDGPCDMQTAFACSIRANCGQALNCMLEMSSRTDERCDLGLEQDSIGMGRIALMGGGSIGLFYLISGFVLTVNYARVPFCHPRTCIDRTGRLCCSGMGYGQGTKDLRVFDTWTFLRKRFARLVPMYLLTNLIGYILQDLGGMREGKELNLPQLVLTILGLTSWAQMQPIGSGVTWTLSTITFFYVCFPVLASWLQQVNPVNLRSIARRCYCTQAVMLSSLYALGVGLSVADGEGDTDWVQWGYWWRMFPLLRLPVFAMGICCGLDRLNVERLRKDVPPAHLEGVIPQREKHDGSRRMQPLDGLTLLWLVASLVCTTVAFFFGEAITHLRFFLEVYLPILFYYGLFAATDPEQKNSFMGRVFNSNLMVFLGSISTSVYMVHILVLQGMCIVMGSAWGQLPWWQIFPCTALSIFMGWFVSRFFQDPVARMLRPRRTHQEMSSVAGEGEAATGPIADIAGMDSVNPVKLRSIAFAFYCIQVVVLSAVFAVSILLALEWLSPKDLVT